MHFKENWEGRTGIDFGIDALLFEESSEFQTVRIYQTDIFGRLMTLDNLVMVTEGDEFIYHEMIVHPAMMTLENAKRILVIGGGDGGTIREVLRHRSVEKVDLVEIDGLVIQAARQFLPTIASAFEDPRLQIYVQDGVKFLKESAAAKYDVIIVDSTDPGGIAEGLFNDAFFGDVHRALSPDGMVVSQNGESPYDCDFPETIKTIRRTLSGHFPIVEVYTAAIPTYAYGLWSFTIASKGRRPSSDSSPEVIQARIQAMEDPLKYYTARLHPAAFALPAFMQELVDAR